MEQNQRSAQLSCELQDDKPQDAQGCHVPPSARGEVRNFDEVMYGYTKEEAIREASRCLKCKKMACSEQCPIHQDIQGYVKAIAEGDFDKSLAIILDKNPFPASIGRVCPQTCASKCALGKKGESIAIGGSQRGRVDYGRSKVEASAPTGKKVAIIGAGPPGWERDFISPKPAIG